MLIVDSHVHIALHMYEPVEILLAQMDACSASSSQREPAANPTTSNRSLNRERTCSPFLPMEPVDPRMTTRFLAMQYPTLTTIHNIDQAAVSYTFDSHGTSRRSRGPTTSVCDRADTFL